MKRFFLGVMLIAFAVGAHAQTNAQSQSGSSASSQQQASVTGNTGNSLTLDTNSTAEGAAHYSGTARILSNPGVSLGGAAAGFSNNNCANTMQGGVSGLRMSVGIGAPKESRACNYRQNAATFYAAAGVRVANGQNARAEALMAMADEQACRAAAVLDETDMDNCKALGLVGNRDAARSFQPTAVISQPPPHPVKPVQKGDFPTTQADPKESKLEVIAVAHP
jgi:hypothetical protein